MANSRYAHNSNATGLKGVTVRRRGYASQICVNGKRIHLGTFRTAMEAHLAYAQAARTYFADFARAA